MKKTVSRFSQDAMNYMIDAPWPGNIRELKNVVERAVYRSDAATISEIDFHPFQSPFEKIDSPKTERPSADAHTDIGTQRNEWPQGSLKDAVWQLKVSMMQSALHRAKYNQKKAARILGLTYHQFRGLYRRYQSVSRSNGK